MAGKPPDYRLFLSDEDGKMDFSGDEFAALWEARKADKNGNEFYTGKTGKGEQWVCLYKNVPKPHREAPTLPDDVDDDIEF